MISQTHTYTPAEHTFAVCAYKVSPYLEECLRSVTEQNTPTNVIISTSTPNAHIAALAEKLNVQLFVNNGSDTSIGAGEHTGTCANIGAESNATAGTRENKNTKTSAPAGIGADWNSAIAHANTPLVTVAHQDDVYLPDYSKRMLEAVNSVEKPLLFFTDYGEIREVAEMGVGNAQPIAHADTGTNNKKQPSDTTSNSNTNNAQPTNTAASTASTPSWQIVDSNRLLEVKRKMLAPLRNRARATSIHTRRHILSLGSAICCPSVTVCTNNVATPLFSTEMKCSLDWDAWEKVSRIEGAFLYDPHILMRHRIHTASETTALIENNIRGSEDLQMLKRFWPTPIAHAIYAFYSKSQNSNG